MRRIAWMVVGLFACHHPAGETTAWKSLFDGHSLDGWEHVGAGQFVVEDGMLRTDGGMGLLWYTRATFGHCVLRVVYRTSSIESNSGVFVRIADRPKDEWFAVHHGFEIQIDDTERDPLHNTGAIYSLAPTSVKPTPPTGTWHTLEITLDGPKITVAIDGVHATDFDSTAAMRPRDHEWEPERGPRPDVGYLGLQNNEEGKAPAPVFFKSIEVRSL